MTKSFGQSPCRIILKGPLCGKCRLRLFSRCMCEINPVDLGNTPSWVCDLTDMTGPYCLRCDLRGDPAVLETAGPTLLTGCKWVMSFSAVAEGTAAQRSHQIKRVHVSDCLHVSSSRESCPFPRASVLSKLAGENPTRTCLNSSGSICPCC